jgi:transposase-like protein
MAYPYLFVDARYEKVRVDGRVVSQGILIYSFVPVSGPVRGLKTLAFVAF